MDCLLTLIPFFLFPFFSPTILLPLLLLPPPPLPLLPLPQTLLLCSPMLPAAIALGNHLRRIGHLVSSDSQLDVYRDKLGSSLTNITTTNEVQFKKLEPETSPQTSRTGLFLPMQVKQNVTEKVAQVSHLVLGNSTAVAEFIQTGFRLLSLSCVTHREFT